MANMAKKLEELEKVLKQFVDSMKMIVVNVRNKANVMSIRTSAK